MRCDPTGEIYHIIAGAVIGAVINMGSQVVANAISGAPLDENLGSAAITGAISGACAASGLGAAGQGIVGAATNLASYVTTTSKEDFNLVECAAETAIGFASGYTGGAGLTSTKKVASQVSIINKNMHAVKTNWRAARTVNTCMKRISGEIGKRINSAIRGGFLSGLRQGGTYRLKHFFGR